jgi:hypothetical protein
MTRIVSGMLLAAVTLVGTPAGAPVPSNSVVYAEVSDQQILDKVDKIKGLVADLEESLKAKKVPTDAARRAGWSARCMPMLNEIERLLQDVRAYGSG